MASKNQLPRSLRRRIFEREGWKCWYCGKSIQANFTHQLDEATVDHVQPESKGGSDSDENLVAACRSCNSQKRHRTLEEYRAFIRYSVKQEGQAIMHLAAALSLSVITDKTPISNVINELENQIGQIFFYGEVSNESN